MVQLDPSLFLQQVKSVWMCVTLTPVYNYAARCIKKYAGDRQEEMSLFTNV